MIENELAFLQMKHQSRKKIFGLTKICLPLCVVAQLVCWGAWADTSSTTPYTDNLLAQLPLSDMDSFLQILPESWRSDFLLIYNSHSLQSASLARPRVVLNSPDHQFFLAFADQSGNHVDDQSVEMIEAYGLEAPRFTEISWASGRPVVTRDPAKCATCHQGAAIFESYPNWPGFFGSSDDGGLYGENIGTSLLAQLEVEDQALTAFKSNAATLPRYRQLVGLDQATLSTQEEKNVLAGSVMIAQLQERQNRQVYESLNSISDLHDAYIMSWPFVGINDGDESKAKTPIPELASESRFEGYRDFIAAAMPTYDGETKLATTQRFADLNDFVKQNGTPTDQLRLSLASIFSYVEAYRPDSVPTPPNRTDIGIAAPDVMIYFDDMDSFRYPGAYYQYWVTQHPEVTPLPLNNSLGKSPIRMLNGLTYSNLLQSFVAGHEDTNYGVRNYRNFEELYEWVPLPLKQYSWNDFAQDPLLSSAVDGLQKTYLDILTNSPDLASESPAVFVAMKSWSPENLQTLQALLAKTPPASHSHYPINNRTLRYRAISR